MYSHGVLHQHNKGDYYGIIDDRGGPNLGLYAPSLESIHKAMEDRRLDVLWVMPGSQFSQVIRKEHFNALDSALYTWYVPEEKGRKIDRIYGARISYNKPKSFNRFLMFPGNREWTTSSAKNKGRWYVESPQDLLQTVNYLQTEYNTNIIWSPSHVALDILRQIHSKQERTIQPLPQEQRQPFLKIARDMCNWVAWKAAELPDGKYIVGFDKNAQFLGAAGSVELGNGGYEEIQPSVPLELLVIGSGFWHYKLIGKGLGQYDYPPIGFFPCPLDRMEGWASTDLIQCAYKMGWELRIYEGIVWREHKRYLREWAVDMWEHRFNLTHAVSDYPDVIARHNAAGTAKQIPNSLIGRLANESSGEYHHPDWNRAIVNRATANQMYTLMKLYRDFHIAPVLVSKDAFYFVVGIEELELVRGSLLKHQHEQCGYKPVGMTVLNSTIREAFQSDDVSKIEQIIKEEMKHG